MDAISYSHSAKQAQRIEKFIENPDSIAGLVTVPNLVPTGETVSIPTGRTLVHPNLQVDGTLTVDGTLFIPSGSTYTATEVDATVVKQNGSVVADDSTVVHKTGNETKAGVLTLVDGLKLQGQNVSPYSGFKNYVINGNFDVWQRGTSFTGLTNGSYSADRWVVYDSAGDINYNVVRNAGVFQGGYGISYNWNSGSRVRSVIQFIENVTRFKIGSQVTVSFEAYTDSTPYNVDISIQGAKGVWAAATPVVSKTISLTNTKTRYSVTLTVPNWTTLVIDWAHLEDTKLALKFDMGTETNGRNFTLGTVQLEEGSVATPFENLSYALQYEQCRRYYRRYATQQNVNDLAYKMRTTPTESGTAPYTYSAEL